MAGLDPTVLAERLRLARTGAGLTQEQAASALKMARTTMVAIERGERPVRAEELTALAKLYKTTTNVLLRKEAIHVDFVAQFRRPVGTKVTEMEATEAIRLLHQLATATVELERRLGKAPQLHYPPERRLIRGQHEQQAEDLALELRNQLGLGLGPVPDMFALAELELSIRVYVRGIASGIAGVFAYHSELGACVLINAKHPRTRQVWTLAHEVAHLLTSRSATDVCVWEGEKSATDRFADSFAAAFLLPGVAIRKRFTEIRESEGKFSARQLVLLSHRYNVSTEALARRMERIGLLREGTYDRIRREGFSQQCLPEALRAEPVPAAPVLPIHLTLLAAEAHARGILSEAQIASMLAIDRVEVRRLLDELDEDDQDLVSER